MRTTDRRIAYAELHAWSNFTFLEGGSHPEELIDRAAELELAAIALTDRDGLYGTVRFASRARQRGVDAIVGSELTFEDGAHIVLLVEDERGYANLCELISAAQMRGSKGDARLRIEDFDGRSKGLVLLSSTRDLVRAAAFHAIFDERFYLELQHHLTPGDAERNAALIVLARELHVPCVATTAWCTRGSRKRNLPTC